MGQILILHHGNTLVLQGRSFNPVESLQAIAKEKCVVAYGTPTMWVSQNEKETQVTLEETLLDVVNVTTAQKCVAQTLCG